MSFLCALPLIGALIGCPADTPLATGYVEGEYVLLAPVVPARIATLPAKAGDRVATGDLLVTLERSDAEAALAEAEATLALTQAQTEEARRNAERIAQLFAEGVGAQSQREDAETRLAIAQAQQARAEAARDGARWQLDQRDLFAPAAGQVHEVLRHPGEIAGPTAPVLTLLPEGAVVLRLYVPEAMRAALAPGTLLSVGCDGCPPGMQARVSHIADSPEFTPPVIYSLESRQKLSYLVEARPEPGAAQLRPGQIVDVRLPDARP